MRIWGLFIAIQTAWLFATPIRNIYMYTVKVNSNAQTIIVGEDDTLKANNTTPKRGAYVQSNSFLSCSSVWSLRDELGRSLGRIRAPSCRTDKTPLGQAFTPPQQNSTPQATEMLRFAKASPTGYLTTLIKRLLSMQETEEEENTQWVLVEIDLETLASAFLKYVSAEYEKNLEGGKIQSALKDPLSSAPISPWANFQGYFLNSVSEVSRLQELIGIWSKLRTWDDEATSYGRPVAHDNVYKVAKCMQKQTASACRDPEVLSQDDITRSFIGTVEGYGFLSGLLTPEDCAFLEKDELVGNEKLPLADKNHRDNCALILVQRYAEAILNDIIHGDLPFFKNVHIHAESGRSIGWMYDVRLSITSAMIAKMGSEGWGDITLSPHWAASGYHKRSCLSLNYYAKDECKFADIYAEVYRDYNSYLNEGLAYSLPIHSTVYNRSVFAWWIPRTELVTWSKVEASEETMASSVAMGVAPNAPHSFRDIVCGSTENLSFVPTVSSTAFHSPFKSWCAGEIITSVGSYYVESGCGIARILGLSKWGTDRHFHLDKFQGCRFLQYIMPLDRKVIPLEAEFFSANCSVLTLNATDSRAIETYRISEEYPNLPYKMGTSETYMGIDLWDDQNIVSAVRCYGVEMQKAYSSVLGLRASNEVSMNSVIKACLFGQASKCKNSVSYSRDNVETVYSSLNYLLLFVQHAVWVYAMLGLGCKLYAIYICQKKLGVSLRAEAPLACALDVYSSIYYTVGSVGRFAIAVPVVLSLANCITRTCDVLHFGEENNLYVYRQLLIEGTASQEVDLSAFLKLLFWLSVYSSLVVEILSTPAALMDLEWYADRYPQILFSALRYTFTSISMVASAILLRGTTLLGVPVDSNLVAIVIFLAIVQLTRSDRKKCKKPFRITGSMGAYLSREKVKDVTLVDNSLQHVNEKLEVGYRYEVFIAFAGVKLWFMALDNAELTPNKIRHADAIEIQQPLLASGDAISNESEHSTLTQTASTGSITTSKWISKDTGPNNMDTGFMRTNADPMLEEEEMERHTRSASSVASSSESSQSNTNQRLLPLRQANGFSQLDPTLRQAPSVYRNGYIY